MSGNGIRALPYQGKLDTTDKAIKLEELYITGQPLGPSRRGLDVISNGVYVKQATVTAEAGSTDAMIQVTGHSMLKGDILRFISTTNNIEELEIAVHEVIDANYVRLSGVLSSAVAVGDTFSVLGAVIPTYSSAGAMLASQTFIKDGVPVVVTEDTVDPLNNIPFPVKIMGITGDINITANDLNVQLSHNAANPDSCQIGDGTEIMLINASGEAQVSDDNVRASLVNIEAQLPATLGQKAMAASLPVVIASDQSSLNINNISGTVSLPTGAATAARQDTGNASLSSMDGKLTTSNTLLGTIDADTGNIATAVSAINGKLATLGQAASANSMPVALSTEQETILSNMAASLALLDNAVNGTTFDVTIADAGTLATEATLAAMSAKLPASLGDKSPANSLSVVQATETVVDSNYIDFSSSNVTNAAYTELAADIGAVKGKRIYIMTQTGEAMWLAIGAAGSEVDTLIIPPGGLEGGVLPISVPANARLSLKKVIAGTISAGNLYYNLMG